ncbi:MAG: 30S ribosomal protein S4 [Candidatus Pacearchaeota archaeon]
MGDPKKQRKKYITPRKMFDPWRIKEEKNLVKKYGLKNRREIWSAEAKIKKIRDQIKKLIVFPERQKEFIKHLSDLGLVRENATIDDVLALNKEKILERRLQTLVFNKKLAKTIKQARQMIAHRQIKIKGAVCDSPGRLVRVEEESTINLKNAS